MITDKDLITESVVVNAYRAYDAALFHAEREHHSPRALKGVGQAANFLNKILVSVHEMRLASIPARKAKTR